MLTNDQFLIIFIFLGFFVALVWGRVRYDLVAFCALVIGTVLGLVPSEDVFSGFGHPAVAIIALVLIVSRGLSSSGAVELVSSWLIDTDRPLPWHISIIAAFGGALSAIINNVAALALLMPLDIEAAQKADRDVAQSLMPLSFATILGGMVTLIGTPPNIVISEYRSEKLGEPFAMFDFAPVGLSVAVCGIVFVSLIGWRLMAVREGRTQLEQDIENGRYVAELRVAKQDEDDEFHVQDLYPQADEQDVHIVGVVREGTRRPGFGSQEKLQESDLLIVEGSPRSIEAFMGNTSLDFEGSEQIAEDITSGGLVMVEAIVPEGSPIEDRSAADMALLERNSVRLLGISREGKSLSKRVQFVKIRAGDVLLFLGTPERVSSTMEWLGVLPIEGRRTKVIQRNKAGASIAIFLLAVIAAVSGFISLSVALAGAVIGFVALGLLSGREVYQAIEWKVIVLLACLIPLADAFESSGTAKLIAQQIVTVTSDRPDWVAIALLMVATMSMSDFLNNVATTLIAAPIAASIASATGGNLDTYLMAVAVAASCAFLTPIGHKNNTIILGPGGYRFSDYWRIGLPLEILVLVVAIPALLTFWPL